MYAGTPAEGFLTPRQQSRRRRILHAAVNAASTGGYALVHMREIADNAEVSMATIYHYFPSKIHLLVSALTEELAAFDKHLHDGLDRVPGAFDRLRLAVVSLINAMQRSDRITEALTHAYAASCVGATPDAQRVHDQTTRMFAGLMHGGEPADENHHEVSEILADVWTSEILALVQERTTFADLRRQMLMTIDLLERGFCSPVLT
ncbi:hypothetical protein A5699_16265 [Mycobacterium sp. E802]|nr:hypothetical protein A5699_16265 [Mycobacterium sp. E802]